ncbi:BF3164 family lipoprotein [Alkalitalea saponilacus]|uniref:TolB-like 6-blade propeller-like n=1 Tax=Alkalitalea saponilacus TaxID=889453 RepID=A0A1T5GDA6_9BACT|nr:BF3164 family lipoprotein [Alkalitalea saponilacus]ASB47936.1 hypothetical protein CDL62_01605 [Alkalitalea saponilacus]SKC06443.1 TolB-like 6-blade propeller-like [Alkalitalea saponilacus]
MKNIIKIPFVIAIFSIIANGCNPKYKPDYPIYHIQNDVVNIDSGFFGNPNKMLISDSLLFFEDEVNNYYFGVIDIKNLIFLKRFGKKGSGPNEIITPSSLFIKNEKFSFNTVNTNIIAEFPFKEIFNSPTEPKMNIIANLRVKNKEVMYSFMTPLMIDKYYLATGFFSNGKYALIDVKNNRDSIFGFHPITENIGQFELGIIFQSVLVHHPSKRRVVNVSLLTNDLLEVITYCENQQFTIKSNTSSYNPTLATTGERIHLSSESKFTYLNFSVTDKFIYLLYSGKSVAEHGYDAAFGNTIHVFDWELNKVCEYVLDFNLQSIAVTADDRYLYSFGAITSNVELLKWSLTHNSRS